MALGLVAIFSFEAVDLFFISQLGDAPLAAVSFTFPVIWLLIGIGIGFEAGASSCVARAVGRGDHGQARRLTTDTAVLATAAAFVLCVIGLFTIRPVFSLLGATEELMPLIEDYMSIRYWVAPVEGCMWTCLAAVRARGNAILEGKVITTAALVNCALDPIFIFGLFGFPRLEMQGAALASLVANLIMLGFTLFHLHRRLGVFAKLIAPFNEILASWRHMLSIGIPAMITNAIIPISNGIVVAMVAAYGVDAVAGFGVAMRIEPMALIPFYALSAVASPFAGQNFAAGEYHRLFEARRAITWFCLGFGVLLVIVFVLAADVLAGLFSDTDGIRQITVRYLWIVSVSYGAYGLVMSVCASFNGIGTPLPAVVISASRVIFLFLPLAFIGRWLLDLQGLFIASALANLTVGYWAYVWLGQRIAKQRA